jgi:hypothetical protein
MRKTRADIKRMTAADVQHLVHELQIHQIELELQNETLRSNFAASAPSSLSVC